MENKILNGFSREDSSTLGFVILCESFNAIIFDEFKEYFFFLIKENDVNVLPDFIWNIIDMSNDEKLHIYKRIIGFVPHADLTDEEQCAIYGIAIKRFNDVYDMPISKKKALKCLEKNLHVLKRFKETFPFIKLDF